LLPIITKVEQQKKNKRRYNIFIQDEYAFSVHEDIMIKHRLLKGEQLDVDQQAQILQDAERHDAYIKALLIIGRRPNSVKELKNKLAQHGYEESSIQWAIQALQQQKYVNDEDFAKLWTENRVVQQRKGRNLVKQELQQKGISKEHIQEAIGAIDPDEEFQASLQVASKKWSQTKGEPFERRRKTAAFLLRRGYTSSLVSKVIQQISNGSMEEELEDSFEMNEYD
jgi:regulatory protein